MVEPGVGPRAIDHRHPRGMFAPERPSPRRPGSCRGSPAPAATRRARGGSPRAACRDGWRRAARPPRASNNWRKRAAAGLQKFDFLPRFGQMKRHRHLRGGGQPHHAAEQLRMDAVRGVRGQSRPPGSCHAPRRPPNAAGPTPIPAPRGPPSGQSTPERPCNPSPPGPTPRRANPAGRSRPAPSCREAMHSSNPISTGVPAAAGPGPAKGDDLADPIDEADPPPAQRRRHVAQIEVRVGVDQARQDGHVAQVHDPAAGRARADGRDPLAGRSSPSPSASGGPLTGKT